MIATGHSTDRNTVAVLGGDVRGRKALSRERWGERSDGGEFGTATSAPYTGGRDRQAQAGQYVSVSGSLPDCR